MASVPDSELEALRAVAEAARSMCTAAVFGGAGNEYRVIEDALRTLAGSVAALDKATRKTLGQVAHDVWETSAAAFGALGVESSWRNSPPSRRDAWEAAADAVIAEHERRKAEGA